ncbi:MAG: fructose-6-phosphate aldolase [Pseudomonadota bacterium]
MKFFLDTANLDEIKEAASLGLIDGVTTNPSLLAKEGINDEKSARKRIIEICKLVDGPVSMEALAENADGMVKEGQRLAGWHDNVVIKIPLTTEGLKATRELADNAVRTNVTLVFSPLQALMAAKAGATYVSPFVGRLDDIGHVGMNLVEQILNIYDNYDFETEVIVASVRGPEHVLDAALMGAHIATIPFKVISQLAKHPLTDAGVAAFLADWKRPVK